MAHSGSFEELIVKLSSAHMIVDAAAKTGLERAAQRVKKAAQDKFGEYQGASGPFVGWAALNPAYVKQKIAHGGSESPLIGIPSHNHVYPTPLRDTIQYKVKGTTAYIGTNDPLGWWHEYGLPSRTNPLPPRPFLRPALYENKDGVIHDTEQAVEMGLVDYFS